MSSEVTLAWWRSLVEGLGYRGLALVMIVVAPEVIMPFAGFLAFTEVFTLEGVVVAGSIGATFGSTLIYLVARQVGEARTRTLVTGPGRYLLLKGKDLDRVMMAFQYYGDWMVFFGRLVPSFRSLVSIPAGLMPMGFLRFVLLTAAGTALWNAVLAVAGYWLGNQWARLADWLGVYSAATIVILLSLLAGLLLHRARRRFL
ncbi:DedA family protein [Alkalilimnicola ehrlichii MLHE-1]|uniref:Alkaline phosphatase n=1 Tax=Alkalilimnicola ehrlichii (strain ATCC BAA-1101 / DSM 17681 / MLHE-1) TaxID=187272 RepID=Q0A7H4_ALKEH|nr:DedA family protein [Alkalilimnicola ehrlichii]ABI57213.1 alkaline phosphatase [Alkalilimnicola ehrlichii MLHE-1]